MKKEIHAWIFVKSDSISYPERNTQSLCGKPLISYTIEAARRSRYINKIFISTDSPDIAAAAEQYGAIVPFLRPAELSNNSVPVQQAWKHAVEWNKTSSYPRMDIMVSLPITVPLRLPADIDLGIETYLQGGCDMTVAVSPSNRNPAYNMVTRDENGDVKLIIDNDAPFARQQSFAAFDLTNMFFICSAGFAAAETNFLLCKTKSIVVPRERSMDIRTNLDLKLAEYILESCVK